MPAAELTAEQRAAIDRRDVSIALSAGAGCGKTHVLTARFLSHLQPPTNGEESPRLGQLIAITFTDAAAREMRSRIRTSCYERLQKATTDEEQHHWLRLLREIDAARISTIHAFCAALLRTHAASAALDPTFAVMDQGDADVLQSEVIDDVLRQRLSELDEDALDLAAAYGLARLKEQITTLIGRRHDPSFQAWLDATPQEVVAKWQNWHAHEAFPTALRQIAEEAPIDPLLALLREADTKGRSAKFVAARAELLDLLPRLEKLAVTEEELHVIRDRSRVQGICSAKDWQPGDNYNQYRDDCKELRDLIDKHKPQPFDPESATPIAGFGLALLRLTNQVAQTYEARKRAQGKLDFDDLLARAQALLTDPKNEPLRGQLADDLCLVLVDEFQDTDQLQADVVKTLCGAGFETGRLFFVGDFKQSIYRFRGAQPSVFRSLRSQIGERGRLPLTMNFRSQPALLHFVNALFCDAFNRDGDGYEALQPHWPQTTETPAVEFLWSITPDKHNTRVKGAALEARRKEAGAIARRLRELLDPACTQKPVVDRDTKQPRQLRPGDVAILFRALTNVQVYEEALRAEELDYYLVGGHAFYAQQEIYDVLNLLRAVASSADEVSLAGALRSPFFALEDETLFWLVDTAGSLNSGLLAVRPPAQLSPEERAKVIAAADTIRHLRAVKDRVPIATLLGEALERTGYDSVLLTEFLGQRKLANLHKLLERARAADHGGTLDLDGFITQLAQFIVQQPKESLAATLPEAADVIRLMTIHQAKGLEFPLVIVSDLDRAANFRSPPAALDRELGPLVPKPADDESDTSTGMCLFAAAERAEDREERRRMLYVATTRAADYLILSSSIEACDKPKSDWMKLLAERFDLADGELLARLPQGYEVPAVRVTPEPQREHRPAGRTRGPDLVKILNDAHELAAAGQAVVPAEVARIPVDHAGRRQFAISRLTDDIVPDRSFDSANGEPDGADGTSPAVATVLGPSPNSRGLGLLVHDLLARIDFRDTKSVTELCKHSAERFVVTDGDAAISVAREMIERFVASEWGGRLAEAAVIHREVEFLIAWPNSPGADASGSPEAPVSYFRGYIDCCYQDSNGLWRILDYKTNKFDPADVSRVAHRYEMQLYLYALAAERALGQPPVELVLHFLQPGEQHTFAWNDAARRRAVRMVNAAIAESFSEESHAKARRRKAEEE